MDGKNDGEEDTPDCEQMSRAAELKNVQQWKL
jgi:hypothetical protein